MNNSFLMRVLHRMADGDEEPEPLLGGKICVVAVFRDLDAAHQFHHEEWPPGAGRAGIEDFGDVGMVHEGQRLALGFEARHDLFGVHPQLDHFKRHAAADCHACDGQLFASRAGG